MLEAVRDSYAPCYHKRLGLEASYHSLTLWRLWSPNSWLPGRRRLTREGAATEDRPYTVAGYLFAGSKLKVNCVVTLIGSPASVAGFHFHCFAASIAAFAKSGSPVEAAPVASLVSRAVEVAAAADLAASLRVAAVAVE